MPLDAALLTSFRSRFESKEPDPKNFVRPATKFEFYLTVEDIVEERRSKGFTWEGIAEDFSALGVHMPVATLKTCFRRARVQKQGATPRAKPPSRRVKRERRVHGDASRPDEPVVASPAVFEVVSEHSAAAARASAPSRPPVPSARDSVLVTAPDSLSQSTSPELTPRAAPSSSPVASATESPGSREEEVPPQIGLPDELLVSPSGPSSTDQVLEATGPAADQGSPQSAAIDRTSREDIDAGKLARPPGETAPSGRDTSRSRLNDVRARASAPETRRLAFVPRDDKEL